MAIAPMVWGVAAFRRRNVRYLRAAPGRIVRRSVKTDPKTLVFGFIGLVVFGLMLFLPAWTFDYWQAWVVLLLIFAISTWIPSIYLMRKNPAALRRRMPGGPAAETRPV